MQWSNRKVDVVGFIDYNFKDERFGFLIGWGVVSKRVLLISRLPQAIRYLEQKAERDKKERPKYPASVAHLYEPIEVQYEKALTILKSSPMAEDGIGSRVGYYTTNPTEIGIIHNALNQASTYHALSTVNRSLSLWEVQAKSLSSSKRGIEYLHAAAQTDMTEIVDWAVDKVCSHQRSVAHITGIFGGDDAYMALIDKYGEKAVKVVYDVELEREKKIDIFRRSYADFPFVNHLTNVYIWDDLYEFEEPCLDGNIVHKKFSYQLLTARVPVAQYRASKEILLENGFTSGQLCGRSEE